MAPICFFFQMRAISKLSPIELYADYTQYIENIILIKILLGVENYKKKFLIRTRFQFPGCGHKFGSASVFSTIEYRDCLK